MTFTDNGSEVWRELPNGILDQDKRQQDAAAWAAQQRAALAKQWADNARAQVTQQVPDWSRGDASVQLPDEALTWQAQQRQHATEIDNTQPFDLLYRPGENHFTSFDQLRTDTRTPLAETVSGETRTAPGGGFDPSHMTTSAGPETATLPGPQGEPLPTPPSPLASPAAPAPNLTDLNASPLPSRARANITDVSQFGQPGLTYDEALAACGPAAAVRLASIYGNNIPLKTVLAAAKEVGWTSSGGMNGIQNEKRLLDRLNIPATLDTNPDPSHIISDAQSGNPVTLSTPNHYFTIDGYDTTTGKYHVGQSGLAYRGGSEWMTMDQMRRIGGGVNGALFVDAPTSPQPSVAVLNQPEGAGYVYGSQPVATGGATSAAPPSGPIGFDGLVNQARDAVSGAGDVVGGAVQNAQQTFDQVVNTARQAVGYTPEQPVQTPGFGFDPSHMQAATAPEPGVPLSQDVRDLGQQPQPTLGERAGQFVVGTAQNMRPPKREMSPFEVGLSALSPATSGLIPDIGNAITSGLERAGVPGAAQTGQRLDTPLGPVALGPRELLGAAAGAVIPVGPEGKAASVERRGIQAAESELLQRTGQMLKAKPPVADEGTLVQRAVRAWTNRNEALDRYQEDTLRQAGLDILNPPQKADASALIREMAADAPTKINVDQNLKPAIQSVGQDQDALSALLMHRNNVDVAKVLGQRAEATVMDRDLGAVAGTSRLQRAEGALRMRERAYQLATNGGDEQSIAQATRDVRTAQRTRDRAQQAVDEATFQARQAQAAEAGATRVKVASGRKFPGGFTVADSQQAVADLEQHLGPERWQVVNQAANQVSDFVRGLRQRMVQSGLVSQEFADQMARDYPNWVPTRVLDYIDDPAARAGRRLSIADAGLKKYTLEGTERFAEDPLASLVGLAQQVETKARKNDVVNALINLDQMRGTNALLKPAKAGAPIRTEEAISRIVNGTVEHYVAPPPLAAIINGPQITNAPGFIRAWTNFQRAVATVVNPAFALVRNPSLDIPEYMTRELARATGNPLALPHIVSELARGYGEALFSPAAVKAMLKGEFQGEAARYLQQAGGSGGLVESAGNAFAGRQQAVQSLSRAHVLEVKSIGDLQRILKDVLTLRPVAAIAERTELGPRIASMRLAEQRGLTPARAALRGRQVTIDFNEGGTLAKTINQFVPFFNAGLQGTAQLARMARENRVGTAAALTMTVGLPAVVAEAWNHADPQRAKDYADVPQYLKDQGVVVMLPGDAEVDAQGNRKPGFIWMNMRGFSPFAVGAREIYDRVVGNEPQSAQELGLAILGGLSPIRANTIGDVPASLMPNTFGISTGTQLAFNKDFFRRRDIATIRNDEASTETAKRIAENLTAVARMSDPRAEIRPSQVQFAVGELLGGVGTTALAAGDMAMGATKPGTTPVISGIARAAGGRNDTGETFRDAREPSQRLPDNILRVIQAGGVRYDPQPVRDTVRGVKLTQAEQTRLQQMTNQQVVAILGDLADYGPWKNGDPESRDKLVSRLVGRARDNAEREFLNTIPDADWNRRRAAP